ncbi:serine protease [Glaciihabitans arcticus]|uniref:Serine protease n=1 Tax=Glaciihabitans arcticus TaxID=2668039 RepID=A0A4Q9GU37_9MICO|nr:serine protease [Glaciihabitans arcticus]
MSAAALVASALVVGSASLASAAPTAPGQIGQTSFKPGRYIVTLADSSVATYDGGIQGYSATKPDEGDQLNARKAPVTKYKDYLADQQKAVAKSAGVTIDASYTMAFNGFSADLTAAQAAELVANRNVLTISPDEIKQVTTTSTAFLGLEGEGGVWESIGGAEKAGEGVVLGVLDTGIAPENPAFSGSPLGTTAGTEPYLSGANTISYKRGDGGTFTGTCQTGTQFTAADCSTKIISARYFVEGFTTARLGDETTGTGEFVSPRDGDGHGSHTASTAAGNVDTAATVDGVDFGNITGVAPATKIAVYKVCWSGKDPAVRTDDGCTTTDLLAGIDQAVTDGVDVINYSIGGGAAETTYSATDDAFLGAAAAGIFVAASAGNDGPDASTLDNASPWITTVAASTIPGYEATATLGDGQAFAGASISVDLDPAAAPVEGALINSTSIAAAGTAGAQANLCGPGTLDATLTEPTIVVCERGVFDRVAKSAEVKRVGGIGMILVNITPGSIDSDVHSVPTVHLDAMYHDQVVAYAATEGATASLKTGNSTAYTPPVPVVAGFSSRGPVLADGSDLLKPDISAPGVAILAAGPNQETTDPSYEFLSGTSMAAPHIAGLAALYLGERPNATPAEIKSAMMTTAYNTVDADGEPVTDPFAQGAGHVDPTKFFNPGLLYLNDVYDWAAYLQALGYDFGVDPVDPSNLNLASIAIGALTAPEKITRTVTATTAGTYTAAIQGLEGVNAVVEPATFTVAAGEEKEFTVTFTRTDAALDAFATGSLTWTSGSTVVRSPIAVQPVTIVAPSDVEGTGVTGSVDVTVTPGGNGDIPLSTTGLSQGVLAPDATGTDPEHSGTGDPVSVPEPVEYEVSVPAGAELARFDLDAITDTADLDLVVYLLNAAGAPVAGWQSATGSADERVDIPSPTAGNYLVLVDVYAGTTAWDLVTTSIVPGGAPLALEPAVLAGQQGVPVTYTASWADLNEFSYYLGLVEYGDTGAYTVVDVTTGEDIEPGTPINTAPPTITGTPEVGKKLTATPGSWDTEGLTFAYQWQADGVNIAKATKATYTVKKADQGKTLTVVVTATKGDLPPGSATSAGVTVKFVSTTKLSVTKNVLFSWQRTTAKITVKAGDAPATGAVSLTVNGKPVAATLNLAANGTVSYELPKLKAGVYLLKASFAGSDTVAGSSSSTQVVWVVF